MANFSYDSLISNTLAPPKYEDHNWGVQPLSRYELLQQIGEGTYGQVFKAREHGAPSGTPIVALKKMVRHHESEGFPKTETREIKILTSLRHQNLVHLKAMVTNMGVLDGSLVAANNEKLMSQSGPTQAAIFAAAQAAVGPTGHVNEESLAAAARILEKEAEKARAAASASATQSLLAPTISQPLTSSAVSSKSVDTGNKVSDVKKESSSSSSSFSSSSAVVVTSQPARTDLGDIFMVFEYVDYDLAGLSDGDYKFEARQAKVIIYQLLLVLDYLHSKGFVHRDLKTSNILLKDDHTLKLADFGLSRSLATDSSSGERADMTNRVITLWYRPPELLLGATRYDGSVDLWSVGCILLELFMGRPTFRAGVEGEQLKNIITMIGTPPSHSSLRQLPGWESFSMSEPDERKPKLPDFLLKQAGIKNDAPLISLIGRLLEGDPRVRITAREALGHPWFKDIKDPKRPLEILRDQKTNEVYKVSQNPTFPGKDVDLHEFMSKKRKRDGSRVKKEAEKTSKETSSVSAPLAVPKQATSTTNTVSVSSSAIVAPTAIAALQSPPVQPFIGGNFNRGGEIGGGFFRGGRGGGGGGYRGRGGFGGGPNRGGGRGGGGL